MGTPPDGLYVPKRGFGLAWRNYSYTRELLGWALAPEFGFEFQPLFEGFQVSQQLASRLVTFILVFA